MLTEQDVCAITSAFGDVAETATASARGRFLAPGAGVGLVEATAPTFTASRAELADAGIARNTRLERVITYENRTLGPFQVIAVEPLGDGVFVELALQSVA